MPAVQRQGDSNSAGGIAVSGVTSVRINNRPVVVPGVSVTPHPCCGQPGCGAHCSAVTVGGIGSVRAGNKPIILTGHADSCGHSRTGGSPSVRAG